MSSLTYIASNHPLPEKWNPHETILSVNEALELDIEVPARFLLSGIDREFIGLIGTYILIWTAVSWKIPTMTITSPFFLCIPLQRIFTPKILTVLR